MTAARSTKRSSNASRTCRGLISGTGLLPPNPHRVKHRRHVVTALGQQPRHAELVDRAHDLEQRRDAMQNGHATSKSSSSGTLIPIPEPEVSIMLAIGLGLMGWSGRHSKPQGAAR